jgi:molecular chaperone GrpE
MSDITEQAIEEQEKTPSAQALGEDAAAPAAAAAAASNTNVESGPAEEHDEGTDEHALQGDVDELVGLAAQRDEYLALAQRTQADFENYRKRMARESSLAQERGIAKVARELLPALDNLERSVDAAAKAVEESGQPDPLLDGVRLVRSELSAALARVGIESFSPLGEVFDPVQHEAVAQQPVEDAESGTVAEVYQAGYRLGGNVIRPARVLVAA